jgi:hypothetical protein
MKLPYAERINYWMTSRTSPDTWIEKAKNQIEKLGGRILAEGFGKDAEGNAAYLLGFEIHGTKFKAIWPVLPTETGNEKAARIQAATMLYHDIKAKCIEATVKGARVAFFEYLLLSDGRTAAHASEKELLEGIPKQLLIAEE